MTCNVPFMMREVQSAVQAAGDTVAGLDDIPYSIIRQMLDVAMATLLELYNAIWMQGVYPKRWKEAIIFPLLKAEKDSFQSRKLSASIVDVLSLKRMVNSRLHLMSEKIMAF